MSDLDIGDTIEAVELNAVAAFPHGDGYALVFVDHDGAASGYHVSEAKLKQLFVVIGDALQGKPSGGADELAAFGF